jgi:hypothetical protein
MAPFGAKGAPEGGKGGAPIAGAPVGGKGGPDAPVGGKGGRKGGAEYAPVGGNGGGTSTRSAILHITPSILHPAS